MAHILKGDNLLADLLLGQFLSGNMFILGMIGTVASLAGTAPGAAETVNGVVAIIQAFTVPIFNILAVISLSVFHAPAQVSADGLTAEGGALAVLPQRQRVDVKRVALNIVTNPMILGIAAGLVAIGLRYAEIAIWGSAVFTLEGDLTFIYNVLDDLRLVATPLALVVLGGGFEFSAVKGMTKEIVVATLFRVVLAPLLGVGVAVLLSEYTPLLSFGQTEYPALISLFGTPVAVSSAIMADSIGDNDEQLAGQLVVWTSVASIVSLFAIVFALMSMGLLAV